MKQILVALLVLTPGLLSAQAPIAELEARLADAGGEAKVDLWSELGAARRADEDLAGALADFRGALKLARELGYTQAIARNLLAIGQIHAREGRLPAAAETLRRARAAADEPEARQHLPEILEAQAGAYAALGRHREAYEALRQAQATRGAGDSRRAAERVAELEAELASARREAAAESSRQGQELARRQQEIARLEPRAARFSQLALAAGVAIPLLLAGLTFAFLSRRRLAKRSSEVIANRDLELEQTTTRLQSASTELEQTAGALERKTFDHNRATSELVQTSAKLDRASTRLDAANALREQTSVGLAETAGRLRRAEDELKNTSDQLGQARRQLDEAEDQLEQLKASYGQDIAELGDRSAAARDRLDEMERFNSTVAQHLKILLVAVRSSLGALHQDAAAGDVQQLRKDVERTRGTVGRTVRLLDRLLQLLMVGRVVRPREEIPMSELAFEAVGQVAGLVANRRAEIVIAPEMPPVVGERAQLLEVLRHLLENGGKFMGAQLSPRLEVGSRRDEYAGAAPETVFFVRDNGIGIDPRDHQRVFVLFEQLDADQPGDGIGLALAKRILEAHGGRIWVESAGEGRGSTFCFTAPGKAEAEKNEPPPPAAAAE